ncbi:c-type cytochrome [Alteromonadaceae bacterium BrNp21-10]|nr:c-type cytochrome [Alteromonadaceae bacterium BrNp21-10]
MKYQSANSSVKPLLLALWVVGLASTAHFTTAVAAEKTENKKVNLGDREGHDMTAPIAAEDIPPAPILMVPDALKSMRIQSGFVLEKVAAEPDVFSPVSMSFDANGRMWIAEMTTFMPDLDGNNEEIPKGNIAILEDSDGDGQVDKRTVFLDDIILPRTVVPVKGGILYSDQTQLYFAEVLAGDKLGVREVVDPTYAKGGSVEHKPNGMMYGLDNWYYNAKSDRRYKILPLEADVPRGAEEIYRNQYWKMALAATEFRGQWGISMDDYGRLFHNWNSVPAQGEYLRPNSLNKNTGLVQEMKANSIGGNRVYPIRINPGVNRAYLPETLISEGEDKGKLANFTAASGNVLYRGDQFPKQFYGVSFTPEPGANLISARHVVELQGSLSGEEFYPKDEILASTDERFRPVNLYTAPDGSLYIVDMYHGVIQHKEFLTSYLRKQSEARGLQKHNSTMGRIYRLRWAANKLGEQPKLSSKSAAELVPYLAHANGWWRDIARRLLVQKNDNSVVPMITKLVQQTNDHRALINGLWTLKGLNGLNVASIQAGLASAHPKVRVSAVELVTRLSGSEQLQFVEELLELASSDYEVALQVALIAGQMPDNWALPLVKAVLTKFGQQPLVNQAVVSGIAGQEQQLLAYVGDDASEDLVTLLNSVGKQLIIESNLNNLVTQEQNQYYRGRAIFEGRAACLGCHGKQGQGVDGMAPPLVNSEWVTGSPERLVKVLLHGLRGPIHVNGTDYNLPMVMPGLGANSSFSDADTADIATYIRNNWGNAAAAVSSDFVSEIRAQTAKQNQPYTSKELSQ